VIQKLVRSYELSAALGAYLIVKFSDTAATSKIAGATAATDALVGTTGQIGGDIGDMCDVDRAGIGKVKLGGTVAAGDPITSNNASKGVKATVDTSRIIGFAEEPGLADDIIDYLIAPSVLSVGA
jgi:hypothetical protein